MRKCKYVLLLLWCFIYFAICEKGHRSPSGIRRRFAAAHLLRLWVWILLVAWMFVCCECYVLSGRGLCNELITYPEESYWLGCIVMCDLETSRMKRLWSVLGRSTTGIKREGHRIGTSPHCELRSHFGGIAPLFFLSSLLDMMSD
jgi:hypothetical protein